jgi:HEAT repeat protein
MSSFEGEGDFKKGGVKPAYVFGGVAVVALIGGIAFMAVRTSQNQLQPGQAQEEVRKILVRPVDEQRKEWRKILDDPKAEGRMQQEAIFQLARLRDADSLPKLLKLLPDTSDKATIRVLAMALMEFPRKDVESAKAALEKKFDAADSSNLPQVAAALVYIRDKDYFDKILKVYKDDKLGQAKLVDGSSAFDPQDLALLTTREKFRALSKDENNGLRQLVATVLSSGATKEDLSTLTELLQDKDLEVSSAASVGVARLNDPAASKILVDKLAAAEKTDNETARKRYIEALKNGIGGAGLVYALKVAPQDPTLESRGRFILEEMRDLADPSAAPQYKEYLADKSNPPHYRAQVALALADIGDPAAVPYLAERMDAQGPGFDPSTPDHHCPAGSPPKCFSNNLGWTMQPPVDADPVTFREHQFSAQDIGDLALLYPEQKKAFLDASAAHIKKFNGWFPAPWLVASRALAYLGDPDTLDWCKKIVKDFKLPATDLVNIGNAPECPKDNPGCFTYKLNEFDTATRYVGYAGDAGFVDTMARFLERPKTKKGDEIRLTQSEMEVASNPGFREVLMNTSQAAVDGFAEWGTGAGKASDKVLKLIEDKDHGLFPRLMGGRAFGLIASSKDLEAALKKHVKDTDLETRVALLMGAQEQTTPEVVNAAFDYIQGGNDNNMLAVNAAASRVVGWGGTKGIEDKVLKLLDDGGTRVYGALIIALGGDEDLVRRGMALFEQKSVADKRWDVELPALRNLYLDSFDSRGLTATDVDSGRLFRFVRNAELMRRSGASDDVTEAGQTKHEWAAAYLKAGFKRLDMNATVPGGVDRLLLRVKLLKKAKSGDDATKALAVDTLKFLGEQGSIMSLREEAGLTGELAKRAFFELRHPEASMGPADKEKDDKAKDGYFSKPKFEGGKK